MKVFKTQSFIGLVLVFFMLLSSFFPASSFAFTEKINYVALGDSLAAGVVPGRTLDIGYTGVIASYLEENSLLEDYTNAFAIPGYTTQNVLDDIVNNVELYGKKNNDVLKDANLITITAGANDLLREITIDRETGTVIFDYQKAFTIVGSVKANLTSILEKIKELNPTAKIYISGYYNAFPHLPEEQQLLLTKVIAGLNGIIQQVAYENGATYVALDTVFGDAPTTYLPDPSDIHPSQAGYELMASAFIQSMFEEQEVEFIDVPENFWAYSDIQLLVDLKLITGVSENTFAPNKTITRAEVAQILYGFLPIDQSVQQNPEFRDVSEEHEAYYAIAKLTQAGVFAKAEKFNPDAPLTRAQLAKVLTLVFKLQLQGTNQVEFTDVPDTHWAKPYINQLVASKVTVGYPDGTFQPEAPTSRAQFATFIVRAMNTVVTTE